MKKRQLSDYFRWIFLVLILLGIFTLLLGRAVLVGYEKNSRAQAKNTVYVYDNANSKIMELINAELLSMAMDNDSVMALSSLNRKSQEDYSTAAKEIGYMQGIQDRFKSFSSVYGNQYYFWMYEANTGTYVSYGQNPYSERMLFQKNTIEKIDAGTKRLTSDSGWFIEDNKYIGTTYNYKSIFIGAWISPQDFLKKYTQLEISPHFEVYLTDDENNFISGQGIQSGNRYTLEGVPGTNSFSSSSFNVSEKNYSFDINVLVYDNFRDSSLFIQLTLMMFTLAFIVFAFSFFAYVQKKILKPVMSFYNQVKDYSGGDFVMEESNVLELDEAAKRVNILSTRVRDLEIEKYRETIRRQEAELGFAQQQIRPHFFVNCLNVIYGIAQVKRTDKIQELCLNISDYMRLLFASKGDMIPLSTELDLINKYLAVMKDVYGQDFGYKVNNSVEDVMIPPLIIQTFVENSVKHCGLDVDDHLEINVNVNFADDGNHTEITIQDSGNGFSQEALSSLREQTLVSEKPGHQIGIINVIKRLALLYHKDYVIEFDNNDTGAYVYIKIPAKRNDK